MATAIVTEYRQLAQDANGHTVPVGQEPALASQVITYTTSTAITNAFNALTRFVRISPSGDECHILFGTAPTALATSTRLADGAVEYFGLDPKVVGLGTLKVAAYDGTT